jgi:hypothetical protein
MASASLGFGNHEEVAGCTVVPRLMVIGGGSVESGRIALCRRGNSN